MANQLIINKKDIVKLARESCFRRANYIMTLRKIELLSRQYICCMLLLFVVVCCFVYFLYYLYVEEEEEEEKITTFRERRILSVIKLFFFRQVKSVMPIKIERRKRRRSRREKKQLSDSSIPLFFKVPSLSLSQSILREKKKR